jgi:hypothetical protein
VIQDNFLLDPMIALAQLRTTRDGRMLEGTKQLNQFPATLSVSGADLIYSASTVTGIEQRTTVSQLQTYMLSGIAQSNLTNVTPLGTDTIPLGRSGLFQATVTALANFALQEIAEGSLATATALTGAEFSPISQNSQLVQTTATNIAALALSALAPVRQSIPVLTAGQSVYVSQGYSPGLLNVFVAGFRLNPSQYVALDGIHITISDTMVLGIIVPGMTVDVDAVVSIAVAGVATPASVQALDPANQPAIGSFTGSEIISTRQGAGLFQSSLTKIATWIVQTFQGFTQNATGAVASTVLSKLQQFVDVVDFGADPTGTNDSTAAFIAALSTGKTVRFVGNFMISGIQLQSGWTLQGVNRASSRLFLKNGANQHMFYGTAVSDIVLKDFYANGNKANQGLGSANPWRGVYLSGACARIRLDNIQVDQCQDHGISMNDTVDVPSLCGTDSVIINCAATNCGSAAHSAAGGPGGTGIGGGATSLSIIGCLGQYNYLNGFKSPSGTYINCLAINNGGGFETGFSTPQGSDIKLIGCRAYSNLSGSGFRHQGQGQQITMIGCSAIGNGQSGIDALGGVNGLTVEGGYFLNNGLSGVRTSGVSGIDGISLHGEGSSAPKNVIITGAQFFDNQATPTQNYALYATIATSNVVMDGTNIVGTHSVAAYYIDPTAMSNVFKIGNFIGNPAWYRVQATVNSTGTGTTTLAQQSIPANMLINGDTLRIKASGRVTGTAGTKLIRLQVGSTAVIFSNQSASQQNNWVLEATIPIGANVSRTMNIIAPTASQTAVSFSTTTAPLTILVNTTPAGGDIVSLDSFEITVE